jgi:Immune inhibitor A-like, MAM domain
MTATSVGPGVGWRRRTPRQAARTLSTIALIASWATLAPLPAAAQAPIVYQGAEVSEVVVPFVFDGDVRDLPLAPEWRPGDPIKEIPRRHHFLPGQEPPSIPPPAPHRDPLLDRQASVAAAPAGDGFMTPILDFDGQGFTGVNPPDTVGDVGPNYYIQMINAAAGAIFTIYDKSDGSVVAGPILLSSLGAGVCASGFGDPVVLYDQLADRWLMSEFAGSGNNLCVYISQTPDPTGSWFNYQFTTPTFPDYPKYAVWPDAYYLSTNESSPTAYALDRTSMLAGLPATFQRFTAPSLSGFGFQALTPSDLDGAMPPPAGAPNYFMRHRDTEVHGPAGLPTEDILEMWEFHVDWLSPANSTFTGPFNISVAEFDSDLCGLTSFSCIPQPATSTRLDPLREVIMWRLQYRNTGSYQTLVGNLVTDVDGNDHAGVRWFELRRVGASVSEAPPGHGGSWSLFQEGTYAPDQENRWMGTIAMDTVGNIAVGYNVSSSSVFPSLRYTGRLAADPAGTMPQGESSLVAGTASNASNRYGDYSAMSVDPVDDCTFWFTGEYNATSTWSTRIGSFKFDDCSLGPNFTLLVTPTSQGICAPADADYTVDLDSLLGFSESVTLSVSGEPAGTTAGFDVNPVTPPGSSTLTIGDIGAATPGSYSLEVTGTAASATHMATAGLDLFDAAPGTATLLTPADGAINQPTRPTFTWTPVAQARTYSIEIATDAGFTNIVDSASGLTTESYTAGVDLATNTTHYWHVMAENACGSGTFSSTFSFTVAPAPGDCTAGSSPQAVFFDDLESGAAGWTHSGTGDTWVLSGARTHSGVNAWHATDVGSVTDQYLVSPAIALPSGQAPVTMQFWNWQTIESRTGGCYDGAVVEISNDGGATWTRLEAELQTDPYDGPVSTGFSNPIGGDDAWCGDPQDWLNSIVDVSAWGGQNVRFRYRLASDSSVSREGWYLDDVKVQSCLALIFADGFESGDTSAWSVTVP